MTTLSVITLKSFIVKKLGVYVTVKEKSAVEA
jgi:hypothetical protein